MEPMKSRGTPDRLKGTIPQSQRPARGGIPAAFDGVIKAAEAEGEDATSAGADGLAAQHGPGSEPGNIPGRAAIIPPDGWNVP